MVDDPTSTPIGARPFGEVCDPKGGPNTLPISRAQGYVELKAGRLRTFLVGRRRYISLAAIDEYIRAREAEMQEATAQ